MSPLLKTIVFGFGLISFFPLFPACSSEKAFQVGPVGTKIESLIDKETTWRGGAIGSALSGILGGRISEISLRASREAARDGRPVAYQSTDSFQRVEVYPLGKAAPTNCFRVREQIYQGGKLLTDGVKEVCQ